MKARKHKVQVKRIRELDTKPALPSCRCLVCGANFQSRSQLDALCNVCWADNEMRPYGATRVFGGGMVN